MNKPFDAFASWSPALRRAVMVVKSDYFGWDKEQRDRYAAAMPATDRCQLEQMLLKDLFGIVTRTQKATLEAVRKLPLANLDRWNSTLLPLTGLGEDSFYLNDFLPKGTTLLDFPTVKDWDQADHARQEAILKNEDPAYAGQRYRGHLDGPWARVFLDGELAYLNLISAAGYITRHLMWPKHDIVDACIPSKLVHGKNHGKRDGKLIQWDLRDNAGGKEAMLSELRHRAMRYALDRGPSLQEQWHQRAWGKVYLIKTPRDELLVSGDNHYDVVFSDISAMEKVRFRSFFRDILAIEGPADELVALLASETTAFETYVRAQHKELESSFDPKVVPLRKKRKVMVHQDAFRGY